MLARGWRAERLHDQRSADGSNGRAGHPLDVAMVRAYGGRPEVVDGAAPCDYFTLMGDVMVPAPRAPHHEAVSGATPPSRARHDTLMVHVHIPDLHPRSRHDECPLPPASL
jgi:hypothetical protein